MKLDPTKAVIAGEKLTGYLLSKTHPIGRYKSGFFLGLGFSSDEPAALALTLKSLLAAEVEFGEVTEFGQKVLTRGEILGPTASPAASWQSGLYFQAKRTLALSPPTRRTKT